MERRKKCCIFCGGQPIWKAGKRILQKDNQSVGLEQIYECSKCRRISRRFAYK